MTRYELTVPLTAPRSAGQGTVCFGPEQREAGGNMDASGADFGKTGSSQAGSEEMTLRDRIGIDVGRRLRLEEAILWAAAHDVRYVDIQLDTADNAFTSFDHARAAGIRRACQKHNVCLGLHTLSAVNVAEYSPFVAEAVDRYLRGYVDVYGR